MLGSIHATDINQAIANRNMDDNLFILPNPLDLSVKNGKFALLYSGKALYVAGEINVDNQG
jgi:hypothetical protein